MSLTLAVGVRRALKMGIPYHYTGVRGPPPEFYAKMECTRCILKLSVVWNYQTKTIVLYASFILALGIYGFICIKA